LAAELEAVRLNPIRTGSMTAPALAAAGNEAFDTLPLRVSQIISVQD
jgi:hypothetical protein